MWKKSAIILACGILTFAVFACSPGTGAQITPEPAAVDETESFAPASPTDIIEQPKPVGGPCGNLLLPVKTGATWNYSLTGPISDTFTRTILSVESSGFTDQDAFGTGTVRTGQWNCENGNLISLNPGGSTSASVSAAGETSEFTTTSLSGVTLPSEVKSGDTWSQSTTLEGTNVVGGLSTQSKNEFTAACTAGGFETITVPAGTFDAVKVTCNINMTITVQVEGFAPGPVLMSMTTTSWYAPGVGWIKSITTGEEMDNTIELTSYSIP